MAFDDQVIDHQRRCQLPLVRLRMLARGEAGAPIPRQVAIEVREAANAVIIEAEAAGQAALAAVTGSRRQPETETFLWARLTRLAGAADEAVSAAHSADAHGLRRHLDRFNALTTAIWTVQEAIVGVPQRQESVSVGVAADIASLPVDQSPIEDYSEPCHSPRY